jgi:hypothetical protein
MKLIEHKKISGIYIYITKYIDNNAIGFKSCFVCGSMTYWGEKRYYCIVGEFVGSVVCKECWKKN